MPKCVPAVPALLAGLVMCAPALHAADLFVPAQFPTIQAAVDAAADGDTIRITPGSYDESVTTPDLNLSLVADGVGEVTIADADQGALVAVGAGANALTFVGVTFTGGDADDPTVQIDGIDADFTACVISNSTGVGLSINAADVTMLDGAVTGHAMDGVSVGVDARLQLTGVTISDNGGAGVGLFSGTTLIADGAFFEDNGSDGVLWFTSNALACTMTDCTISGNGDRGIYRAPDGSEFTDCTFSLNGSSGFSGDGVFTRCLFLENGNDGIGIFSDTIEVIDCEFINNDGDGISADEVTATECVFIGNRTGGIDGDHVTATDCLVRGGQSNFLTGLDARLSATLLRCRVEAAHTGIDVADGAITDCHVSHCTGTGIRMDESCVIVNSTVEFCGGDGISAALEPSLTVRNSIIRGNSGAGVKPADSTTLHGCLIAGNRQGGVDGSIGDELTMVNCTIAANSGGPGVDLPLPGPSSIANSIIWGNIGTSSNPDNWQIDTTEDISVVRSCIEGGWTGLGNINADPMFVSGDAIAGDLAFDGRLMPGSPCTDAGGNLLVPLVLLFDALGCPRIADIDGDGTATVNMGAFESSHHVATAGTPPTLQQIIDTAGPCDSVIVLGPGVYAEALELDDDAVALVSPAGAGATLIDGSATGRAIHSAEGAPYVTVRGVTLRGQNRTNGRGAVARVAQGGSLALDDCIIQPATAPNGGALAALNSGLILQRTSITGSAATTGAGGAIFGSTALLVVSEATLSGNDAATSGGAIHADDGSALLLLDSDVSGNTAGTDGGGVFLEGSVVIRNSTIEGNLAMGDGGGLALTGGSGASYLTDVLIADNSADGSGGGVHMTDGVEMEAEYVRIRGNDAGVAGGAAVVGAECTVFIENALLTHNTAPTGGAIGVAGGEFDANHVTIGGNGTDGANGGVIALALDGVLTMASSIVASPGETSVVVNAGTVDITYSDVRGGAAGEGNIDAEPLFRDPDGADDVPGNEDDDFELMSESLCVNAADTNHDKLQDLNGESRPLYGRRDMGCFEYRCPGDAVADGTINFSDLNALLDAWGATDAEPRDGDFDLDGDIDFTDLNLLLESWGEACND